MALVIAHRGASGYRPEHTAAAVRLGIELGAAAVEPDLVPTRDGVLVVRHEPEISGTTDVADRARFADRRRTVVVDGEPQTGWFTVDFTWEELAELRAKERLPQLRPESAAHDGEQPLLRCSELIDLLPDEVVLVAELKHPAFFASLGYDIAGLLMAEVADRIPADRLVVECFELPALLDLHARGLAAEYVLLSESPIDLDALPASIGGVSYAKSLVLAEGGERLVQAAQSTGRVVYAWTLRPENAFLEPRHRLGDDAAAWGDWRAEYAEVLATGVDGVFADHPDLVRELTD
jgi:glycerophosphoryl diester phosphodiesterase